jgi:dihydropteroate synthase
MPITLQDILQSHRTHRAVVMGILNVTPDSFSDGGAFLSPLQAVAHAQAMVAAGADVIDVGAESTRPGSDRVGADEQIARLRDVLPAVAKLPALVSIDTTRAAVARFALQAGATIINDVSAGREDAEMFALAADSGAAMVLMHMAGEPKTMQVDPHYDDVVGQVRAFLAARLTAAEAAGLPRERLIVDPGIGFGKGTEHNLALLAGLDKLVTLGRPVLVGTSRKRFIGELAGAADPAERLPGSLAALLEARRRGATIFRVHDVAATVGALKVAAAIDRAN